MPTSTAPAPTSDGTDISRSDVAGQLPIAIYSCSRIGLRANPPRRFSFLDRFRIGRNR
jgi:hypothetical protein